MKKKVTQKEDPMQIENDIEKYLVRQVKKIGGLCYKWVSPGTRGVPDRIVIFRGNTLFVELKRPGAYLRKNKRKIKSYINQQGVDVYAIDTKTEVDQFIQELKTGDKKHEM